MAISYKESQKHRPLSEWFGKQTEVNNMPGGDRTGPKGRGPKTGRGRGSC